MAVAKSCLASSLVRIFSASSMPSTSSLRMDLRSVHSSDLARQASCAASKNLMSAARCCPVPSKSSVAVARFVSASALSASCVAFDSFISLLSVAFSATRPSNSRLAMASALVADSRSEAKVVYMSFRMPWTVPDCGWPAAPAFRNSLRSDSDFAGTLAPSGSAARRLRTARWPAEVFSWRKADPVASTSTEVAFSIAAMACFISSVSAA
mmetsp:Transcript_28965/g.85980  ORF Transcript_28965/g.85980 Transcript_28965/m.85980 type:complete len:210 (-) Transcript_28965:430-1059(-)